MKNVQTCKGSHTHTIVPSPTDKNVIYLYASGRQGARPDTGTASCGCRRASSAWCGFHHTGSANCQNGNMMDMGGNTMLTIDRAAST